MDRRPRAHLFLLLAAFLVLLGCGGEEPTGPAAGGPPSDAPPPPHEATAESGGPTLADILNATGGYTDFESSDEQVYDEVRAAVPILASAADAAAPAGEVRVDYPAEGSVFPPDMVAPTLIWRDTTDEADIWCVRAVFQDGTHLDSFTGGPKFVHGTLDLEALGPTNAIYEGTLEQQSARMWTPSPKTWARWTEKSVDAPLKLVFTGISTKRADVPVSRGSVTITTSSDPVGAPIFYRDVPLMPVEGKRGVITPLAKSALPLIKWRLRDLSEPTSRVVMRDMPTCANCHSFSADGQALGMDVDGPHGDKGAYMIAPIEKRMVIGDDRVISWNDFTGKPEGHKTIGFSSRISPEGRYVVTTLNESLYVTNFIDFKFLQVFYPTRGILAYYDTKTREMKALPGADDPEYVHTNAVWTPDGEYLVFSRAKAFDAYVEGQEIAGYANDPLEPRIQYDLYRIPFNEGKGGTPEPIAGASANARSNTFPKVSPDGKWIVWTKCKNGQLMRPDGRLWIVRAEGGEAREMACNLALMNSWHSFSPNSRWLVWSSKANTPYTQMFLTHLDDEGRSSPAILVPNATAPNRAVNLPEFLNAPYEGLEEILVPAVNHHRHFTKARESLNSGDVTGGIAHLKKAVEVDPDFLAAHLLLASALHQRGRRAEALVHFEEVIEAESRQVTALIGAGTVLRELDRDEEAIEYLKRAMAVEARKGAAADVMHGLLRSQGLKRAASGDVDGAVESMSQAIEIFPEDAVLRDEMIDILTRAGRDAEALQHLRARIEITPDDPGPRVGLVWVLAAHPDAALRNGREAFAEAETASGLASPDNGGILDAKAAALAELGRFEEAAQTLRDALERAKLSRRKREAIQSRLDLYTAGKPYRSPRR